MAVEAREYFSNNSFVAVSLQEKAQMIQDTQELEKERKPRTVRSYDEMEAEFEGDPLLSNVIGEELKVKLPDHLTAYNVSAPLNFANSEYVTAEAGLPVIFSRGDIREKEFLSKAMPCELVNGVWTYIEGSKIFDNAEDPRWAWINGRPILTFVNVTDTRPGHLRLHQEFWEIKDPTKVADPNNYSWLVNGPPNMKDITLVQGGGKEIVGYGRPQTQIMLGEDGKTVEDVLYRNGGNGKVTEFILASEDELRDQEAFHKKILGGRVLDLFEEEEHGGINYGIWDPENKLIKLIGHVAKKVFDDNNNLKSKHYAAATMVTDPFGSGLYTPMKIVGRAANFPGELSKDKKLRNIVFPGGFKEIKIANNSPELAKIYGDKLDEMLDLMQKDPVEEWLDVYLGLSDARAGEFKPPSTFPQQIKELKAMRDEVLVGPKAT